MLKFCHLKFLITAPLIVGALLSNSIVCAELPESNLEVNSFTSKLDSLGFEKKVNKSLFLPELSINGGLGSEKILDRSADTEKGPYLFLDGRINLYRGGRDSNTGLKTQTQIDITKIERELKKRNLNIESFKIISELNYLAKDNQLIVEELKNNKSEQAMAKKKVDAGLTTSVDLLDFELKSENLSNEMEKNNLKTKELELVLKNLYGGNVELETILKNYSDISQSSLSANESDLSPDILLVKKQLELSELDKINIKAEYLPTVELEAKWGQITPHEKLLSTNREHQVALNINIPLFSGFSTEGKLQQVIIESTQKKRELRQGELNLSSKKEIDLKKIDLFKRLLSSNERLLSKAQKYRELTIGEYKRGIKNSPDVILASDKRLELERKILETQNELSVATYSFTETFKSYKAE
ncbi:MAG: TolC family protein [Bacteriovorax sp.]|nr:TolC family protein [Bacteriovorax sp.]